MLRHRLSCSQVLIVKAGDWELVLNDEDSAVPLVLAPWAVMSVPVSAWRSLRNVGSTPGLIVSMLGGDARKLIDWHPAVVKAALQQDMRLDAAGYVAPAHLLPVT